MLNGHIDTTPVGVGWTVDPFGGLVRDGFVHGIGVSNMKASCAAFFGAARAVRRSGVGLRGDLVLAFVVGELQGGVGTKRLVAEGMRTDHFIVGEPTDLAGRDPEVGAVAPYRYYGTDAPFLAAAGAQGVVCGVGGRFNTMPDEKVSLADVHGGTRLYAAVAADVCA